MRYVTSEAARRGRIARRAGAALVLWLVPRVAQAETVRLAELEQSALVRRSAVAAARARVEGARAGVSLAQAPLHPTVSASVTGEVAPGGRLVHVTDVAGDDYLMLGSRGIGDPGAFTPDLRYGALLNVGAQIYDFGRGSAEVSSARDQLAAAGFDERGQEQGLRREVESAYLAWLGAFGARSILRRSLDDATALRTTIEARIEEGSLSRDELSSARYDEAHARLELERALTELELDRLALERAAARALPRDAEPDFTLLDAVPPSAVAGDVPEAEALERRRAAFFSKAAASRAAVWPVLSGGVDVGVRGQTQNLFPVYRVGLSLTLPILDGGLASASAAVASARAAELSALAADTRDRVALERNQARQKLAYAEHELAAAKQLVAVADRALSEAKERLNLGGGRAESVIAARAQRSRAELELWNVRLERTRAVLELTDGLPRPP